MMNPKRLKELREELVNLHEWARIELTMENDVPTREVWQQIHDWAEGSARKHNLTLDLPPPPQTKERLG